MLFSIILTKQEANVNCQDNDHWTPLHYAAAQGHMAVLEILIDEGKAKTTARDRNAHTAIDVVGVFFFWFLVRQLIRAHARTHARTHTIKQAFFCYVYFRFTCVFFPSFMASSPPPPARPPRALSLPRSRPLFLTRPEIRRMCAFVLQARRNHKVQCERFLVQKTEQHRSKERWADSTKIVQTETSMVSSLQEMVDEHTDELKRQQIVQERNSIF